MFGREEKVSALRLTAVQYVVLFIFLLLAYGLWRLQVMRSDEYALLAEKNRVRNVPILAPRGKILDREGRIIVDNYPSFSALLLRDSSRDLNADADAIAKGLHLNTEEVRQRIRRFSSMPQYQPIFLKEDITPDELAFIESHKNELPELETIMAHRRLYPRNGFMAHLVGYVGEVTEDMLNQPQFELYTPGDVVGVSGVEKQYNNILMGKNGSRRAIVNSRGREVSRLDVQDHYGDRRLAGRDCPDPQRALQRGRHILWPALRMLGEKRPWRGRTDESHLPVLRCFLLHAGGKTRHSPHRKICD